MLTFFCAANIQFIVEMYCEALSIDDRMTKILDCNFLPTGASLVHLWISATVIGQGNSLI